MPFPITGLMTVPYTSPFLWSLPMMGSIFMELTADFLGKEWTILRKQFLFVISLSFYVIGNTFWIFSVLQGVGLSRGAIIFSIGQEMMAIAIGLLYFKEKVDNRKLLGLLIGLMAIGLIGVA